MRYCWTYSPFLSLLFILSCLDSGICLKPQEIQVMNNLSSSISFWKAVNPDKPCGWRGVNCTGDSVTELHMSSFNLTDIAWQTVCQLPSLKNLDVSNNFLSIPSDNDIECCTSLVSLNISSNYLSGSLPSLEPMSQLQYLDVSYNRLGKDFGLQIQNLTELIVLNLTRNNFTGSIPHSLRGQRKLEKLDLSHNSFSGEFPTELVNCTNLAFLDLSFNALYGRIPDNIGSFANLKTLNVSANNFSGEIPGGLGSLLTLTHFSSNQNQLAGSIPDQLVNLKRLQFLDLSYNRLNGSIPAAVFSLSNLQTLDLTQNKLSGQIPQSFSSKLFRLRIGNNSLNGSISSTIGNATGLTYLELNNNLLYGQIPPQLGNCTNLQLLNLGQNNLTGSLPSQLASLRQLQVLKLPNNQFYGSIPDIPSTLSNLSYIDLSGNHLSGLIPPKIFNLPKLQNLRLQNNNLTGVIPKNVQDGQFLLELQLGGNNLNGTIPPEIGSAAKLQIQLSLSCNSLEGEIPSSLSRLSMLEILDISNNKLTGEIPGSLTLMISLTLFNVSNNRLNGTLPFFRNGLNISDAGNPDLCTGRCGFATANSSKKKVSAALLIGVAIAGAVFGIGVVALFIVAWKYFRHKVEGHFIHPDSIHRLRIDFEKGVEATLDPANIFLNNKFSTYYKAAMPSGFSYHVKKLNWTNKSLYSANYQELGAELEKQGKLRHPNILAHLAHVLDKDRAYLFYEYVQKGCLSEFLHTSNASELDWPSRCGIAIGVAQGLAFLHGCQRPIFHLDLTTKNILLKSLTEPQIGDIELFKIIDPSKSTGIFSVIAGSVGYVPPEYAYTMRVTAAGNVYSFGVILLELLTGRPTITSGMDLVKWVQSTLSEEEETWEQVLDTRISNFSLEIQNEMISTLKVALSCISSSPDSRPEMRAVVEMLQMVRQVAE